MRKKTVLLTENQLKSVIKRILLEIRFFQHELEKEKNLSAGERPEEEQTESEKEEKEQQINYLKNKKLQNYELLLRANQKDDLKKVKYLSMEIVKIENELEDSFGVERDLTNRPEKDIKYYSLASEFPDFMLRIFKRKAKQELGVPPMRTHLNPGENP